MKYQGILTVDCSWCGMGCVAYIQQEITWAKRYDIRYGQKGYQKPLQTIKNIRRWMMTELCHDVPMPELIDVIVIENQFHTKMKYLQYSVASALSTWLHTDRVYFVSALECKRFFNLPVHQSHASNKREMLKYVVQKQNHLICGSLHNQDDNLADSIAILNTFLSKRKLTKDMSLNPNGPAQCPECNQNTLWINEVKKEGINKGKLYQKCSNRDQCTYYKFLDDKNKKRPREYKDNLPPAKQQKTDPLLVEVLEGLLLAVNRLNHRLDQSLSDDSNSDAVSQ